MSEPDEIRNELDEIRDRVTLLEVRLEHDRRESAATNVRATVADRSVTGFRIQLRDDIANIDASIAELTAMLTCMLSKPGES